LTQVAVDDDDTLEWPAEGKGALAQRVLPLGALGILEHLAQRALAHVQVRLALEMRGGDLVVQFEVHAVAHLFWQLKAISVRSWTTSTRIGGSRSLGV